MPVKKTVRKILISVYLVRKFALPIRGWRGPTSEKEREVCDATIGEKNSSQDPH